MFFESKKRLGVIYFFLIGFLGIYWLSLNRYAPRIITNFRDFYTIEDTVADYHYDVGQSTIFSLIFATIILKSYLNIYMSELIRSDTQKYYWAFFKSVCIQAIIFTIVFEGVDLIMLFIRVQHTFLFEPIILLALGVRYLIFLGYYIIQGSLLFLVMQYTKNALVTIFIVPFINVITLEFCRTFEFTHPISSMNTIDWLWKGQFGWLTILTALLQVVIIITLLAIWNIQKLRREDLLEITK